MDLKTRCNDANKTLELCPEDGVEDTTSMAPTVIKRPHYVKEEYAYYVQMSPKHVRLEMNPGDEKIIDFSYFFISSGTQFVHDLPKNFISVRIFHGSKDITEVGINGIQNAETEYFSMRLRLIACPRDPNLWKENHYQLNATQGQTMHIYLKFLCLCSCDSFANKNVCRSKTYEESNPCSLKDTCTECLRSAECNWCSDPGYSNYDGSPIPRCNNDTFYASKLCPETKKVNPPWALTGSEDCTECRHTCSGGICSESS